MNRITVIQEIIKKTKAKTYLEIGIQWGRCFLEIKATKKIGVDPKISITIKRKCKYYFKDVRNIFNKYYEMTSDDFFKLNSDLLIRHGLDGVFIDGLHTYEQSLKDVNNSLKYLKECGVIIMHDCNPPFEATAYPANSIEYAERLNLPGWTGEWCGDVWKTIAHLRSTRSDLNIFVLDYDYGLGIITKGKPENMLKYSTEEMQNLSYDDLQKNRINILNLKSYAYFEEFIKTLHSKNF